jgi:hypothetical protein
MKKKSTPRSKQKAKRPSVATKKIPMLFSGSSNVQPKKHEQLTGEQVQRARNAAFLAVHARSTILRLEAQDRSRQAIEEENENAPMISAPIWHVHQR